MTESKSPCKVLISSVDQHGHVNPCIGLGSFLVKRGNQVFFLNRAKYRAETERQGIAFLAFEDYAEPGQEEPQVANNMIEMAQNFGKPDDESKKSRGGPGGPGGPGRYDKRIIEMKYIDTILRKVTEIFKPDVIIGDFIFHIPFSLDCPVPFVPLMSHAPLCLYNGPPNRSGLSINDPPEKWQEFRNKNKRGPPPGSNAMDEWFRGMGVEPLSHEEGETYVKYIGIYIYPEAVDYKELGSPKKGWVRLDSALRIPENLEFEIPECLKNKPGKLIFLSLGSFGSANLVLMRRLVATLSKSPHQFIVSKGPLGDQLQLAENMWGQNFLNQLAILAKVDLVITHGGNNTFVETLSFGKPMIAIPLMGDQKDNAQRLEDLKLGRKFDGFTYQDEEFLQAIEDILSDSEIHKKMADIAESLRNSKPNEKVCCYIEQLARTGVSPI